VQLTRGEEGGGGAEAMGAAHCLADGWTGGVCGGNDTAAQVTEQEQRIA